jgi:CRISPR/Cas system CSM-associated protein Csm3 (group 7 of RAMP superfamily)
MSVSAYYDRNFDAMPGRALVARWMLTATLQLETAAHFGGQGDSALDMPILRCARTGLPLLPGTSLGGALRAYLLDRLAGFLTDEIQKANNDSFQPTSEADRVAMLFGAIRGLDIEKHTQSPLIVFDALGTLPAGSASTEVRDGVLIESATGIAADQKKFDFEVLPPGTAFNVRFDVLVSGDDDETELFSLLCASLEGLDNGDIRIGLRRSRGLGEVACGNWTARRYDLATPKGWIEWIASEHVADPDSSSQLSLRDAIQSAMPEDRKLHDPPDNRHRVIIEVEAAILGDLLIRSPNVQADGPDVMHLSSGGRPILSGTSLTGVMRAHALRITQLVKGLSRIDAEKLWIDPLFGPREERTKNPDFKPSGSRLRVSEQPVTNGQSQRVTRVAIDRFTQGVVPTALFDEQPHVGGTVRMRFELRNHCDGEVGLMLLVLKDLLTSQLPVGGTSSVGRGVLVGRRMTITGADIDEPIHVTFDEVETRRGRVPSSHQLDMLVQEFVQATSVVMEPEGATP